MQGFDKFTQEMKDFEQSSTYKKYYEWFNKIMFNGTESTPITSKWLEKHMGLAGPQIRNLVKHSRRKGVPIASSERGYYFLGSYDRLMDHVDHLQERAMSMLFTVSCMKEKCPKQDQLEMQL